MKISPIKACPNCDSLLRTLPGQDECCPTCLGRVYSYLPNFPNNTLVYALSGLVLFVPANVLPLMTFEFFSLHSSTTMLNGAWFLWRDGFWWMAFLVFVCSVIMPLAELILVSAVSALLMLKRPPQIVCTFLKWVKPIQEWAMLEVYFVGLLVAYIRMADMGKVVLGLGIVFFMAMLAAITLTRRYFDVERAFEYWEHKRL